VIWCQLCTNRLRQYSICYGSKRSINFIINVKKTLSIVSHLLSAISCIKNSTSTILAPQIRPLQLVNHILNRWLLCSLRVERDLRSSNDDDWVSVTVCDNVKRSRCSNSFTEFNSASTDRTETQKQLDARVLHPLINEHLLLIMLQSNDDRI